MTSLLDHPVWHALTGPHRRFATGSGQALRYVDSCAPLAALRPGHDDGRALAPLFAPDQTVMLMNVDAGSERWRDWQLLREARVRQYVWDGSPWPMAEDDSPGAPRIVRLGHAAAAQATALAERVAPGGPFRAGHLALGRYWGVFVGDELVAMAGERLCPSGWREIATVATAPTHRGLGYAAALVRRLVGDTLAAGDLPFLHVAPDNPAQKLYRRLGFVLRRELPIFAMRRGATLASA